MQTVVSRTVVHELSANMHVIGEDTRIPRNQNYVNDIVYVTKHSEWILKSLGIWPEVLKGTARFRPKIVFGFSNVVLFLSIIPCILHIVFERKNMLEKLELCGLLGFCVTSLMKYWALAARYPKLEECIEQVQFDWMQVEFQRDRKMMLKNSKMGRNLTILCIAFMYSGVMIYHTVLQYAKGTFVDERNRTIKPLVYPIYSTLFDVQGTPVYELIYIVHCLCGYVTCSVTAGACTLAALFITHACGQIDIILSRLDDLIDGKFVKGKSSQNARLIEIVEHHLRTLRFSAMIEIILQEVCFVEFVSSTVLICMLEYLCITNWEKNNSVNLTTFGMLLVSLTFNVFIFCYIGDLLMEKTSSIGFPCFTINWYQLPPKTIRSLILIVAMSNYPAKISAGRIVDLTLSTFGSVLKTSLAYLSFLRTTM